MSTGLPYAAGGEIREPVEIRLDFSTALAVPAAIAETFRAAMSRFAIRNATTDEGGAVRQERPFPELRNIAMRLAVELETADPAPHQALESRTRDALKSADAIYAWLTAPGPPVRLVGHVSPIYLTSKGNPMANPQVPTSYSFTITIDPEDLEGNEVSDSLTWTSSDPADAPVTADPTSLIGTVEVVNPATGTTITATDGTNSYVYEFDGVVDAPVNLVGTVSAPFKTPAAPAATAAPTA